MIKLAMIECHNAIKAGELNAKMLLQVHDELIMEVPVDYASETCCLVKKIMQQVIPLSVTLVVDVEVGESWGNMDLHQV
jgi:DNA polymerase-1